MKKTIFIAKLFLLSLFLSVNAFGQDLTISPENIADEVWVDELRNGITGSAVFRSAQEGHLIKKYPNKAGFVRTGGLTGINGRQISLGSYSSTQIPFAMSEFFVAGYDENENPTWISRVGCPNAHVQAWGVVNTENNLTVAILQAWYSSTQNITFSLDQPSRSYTAEGFNRLGTNLYEANAIVAYNNSPSVIGTRVSWFKALPMGVEARQIVTDKKGNLYVSGLIHWSAVNSVTFGNTIHYPINQDGSPEGFVVKINPNRGYDWSRVINTSRGNSLSLGLAQRGEYIYSTIGYNLLDNENSLTISLGNNNLLSLNVSNSNLSIDKQGLVLLKFNIFDGNLEWLRSMYGGIWLNTDRTTNNLDVSSERIYMSLDYKKYKNDFPCEINFGINSLGVLGSSYTLETISNSDNNAGILSYKMNGDLLWGLNIEGENEVINDIVADDKNNVYATITYESEGKINSTPFATNVLGNYGNVVCKVNKCGLPFWTKTVNDDGFTGAPTMQMNCNIEYYDNNRIYVSGIVPFIGHSNNLHDKVLRLKNTPETSCVGLELVGDVDSSLNPTNWQWYKDDCATPIAGANLSSYTANQEGNYHATVTVTINGIPQEQSSNAVWVNMTPEYADFKIEGETRVCLNTYQYSISNIQNDVTYEWKLDGVVVQTGSAPFSKTWTATDAGIRTISITATTNGECIFTKSLEVEVFDPAPPLNMSPDVAICEGDNQTSVSISARTFGYDLSGYSWSPTIGLVSPTISGTGVILNQLPNGTTTYTVTATMANGCTNTGTVSITKGSSVALDIPEESICVNAATPLILSGGLPLGGVYSGGQGVYFDGTNYIFDPSGLQSGDYEITYTNDCGSATDIIEVKSGRKDYNLQIMACAGSNQAEVFLTPSLSNGDELELLGQTYTSGGYWNISSSIGTSVTATITNNTTATTCGGTYINNSLNTVTVTVVEAPAKDLYYKDHPFDFGQQPSGGGWNSPSISVTRTAPPVGYDLVAPLYPSLGFDINTQPQKFIKFYYSDGNASNFATVEAVVDAHPGTLVGGVLNYIYLRVYNKCGAFGEGLQFDVSFSQSVTALNPGGWTSYLPTGLIASIPRDLPSGGELIIAIPVDAGIIGIGGGGHTCSYAQLFDCINPSDLSCQETSGFGHLPLANISGSNNKTWRNLNFISAIQGDGTVTIKNDDLVGKMVRVKYDFDPHTPGKAHYLEYNSLQISLPPGLLSRWSANNYLSNNVDFINGSSSLVRLTEQRNGWMEFWLDAGESYTLGLSFGIPPSNNLSLQDPVYVFHVSQHNEGVPTGGVSYNLMIDFVDVAPVVPSNLQAQAISSSKIELTWLDNSDNEQVFVLERRILGSSTYEIVANINENEITYTDEGLDSYTTYQYRLKAMSSTGLVSDYIYAEATTHISSDIQISGTIRNHVDNAPVGEVVVELLDANNTVISQITTISDGVYSFNVLPNTIYKVRPSKDINPHNGVDNADLQAIGGGGASAGGTPTFNNTPYLFLAADVNGDCRVNLGDRMMLRNFVLGNISSITAPSWKFVSSDYDLSLIYTNYSNNLPCFENTRVYNSITASYINQDFVGVKTGDITGDVDPLQKVQIKEEVNETTFKASPNPFTTSTTIHFSSEVAENYTMVVRNSLGQEIKRIEGVTKKGNNKVEINMLGYSSGLYYVEYISSDRRENIKIVLAR
ncbi:T9SS type A sorting domain-containing protein [Bernardetia sp. MNP-M8]|uniref:T9SS type A sorting domain-containing protein n=1 Tax=Bernardetia sp. MNP-M8 TaxID=3127470 RepID=UPI0030D58E67